MEALYSKLYDKYTKEKKKKESHFDKLNHDQEVKFLNYAAAADEMIQYLKSESDRLYGQVDELKSELASVRAYSDEQNAHYQKLLMEENQKNKELSEEISRLQQLEFSHCTACKELRRGQKNSHDTPSEERQGITDARPSKKRKSAHTTEDTVHTIEDTDAPYVDVELHRPADQYVLRDKCSDAPPINQQPVCCQRKMDSSGGDARDTSSFSCMFQYLVEFVVGMKVSPATQSNELCILAHHQSSGYSFSLTWITNSHGEVELLYRVLSLGTFERVAPEWMKETLMFSTSMCSVFFDRISRVIKS